MKVTVPLQAADAEQKQASKVKVTVPLQAADAGQQQASKLKVTVPLQAADAGQQDKADIPPEPTTPDAMAHMPEPMKTEYKRLKEQLALRESKTRQPLTTVNQDKGICGRITPPPQKKKKIIILFCYLLTLSLQRFSKFKIDKIILKNKGHYI